MQLGENGDANPGTHHYQHKGQHMRKRLYHAVAALLVAGIVTFHFGCKKDNGPTSPTLPAKVQTYAVALNVLNPLGTPQGGATVSLVNPPYPTGTYADQPFDATTDTLGNATIQSPAGTQTVLAKIGTLFQASTTVKVIASNTPTAVPPLRLAQNTTMKVLVVQADCEQLETVLASIGFTAFDKTYIGTLRDHANNDSVSVLNYLKTYNYVFSDCDCSTEQGPEYGALSRVYGRYVAGGGKMYGGHYNYYHLQRIWTSYYQKYYTGTFTSSGMDSIQVINAALASAAGFRIAQWSSGLSNYELFNDIPTTSTVYAVMWNSSPKAAVIVLNVVGSGKYVWTNYHNQDVMGDQKLLKLIQYFLWSM